MIAPPNDMLDDAVFARLARKIAPHSEFLCAWALHGGVSAQVTAMEIRHADGQTQRLIVRQHGAADLARNPHVAVDEFALLQMLRAAGLPTATPYYLDQSGELFATPVIAIEYIEGEPEFAPADLTDFIRQFAAHLAQIHQVNCSAFDVSFLPQQAAIWADKISKRPARLDDSLDEGRIRDALEAAWPWAQTNVSGLLHGDYWPGNLLWRGGRLVGVIDWEDAAIGDPLADIAISRLDLLWTLGADAMRQFTRQYAALAPIDITNLPYWDLCAALRPAGRLDEWASDEDAASRMRERHREFVTQAIEQLAAR